MTKLTKPALVALSLALTLSAQAKIITVTTEDNVTPPAGTTNLAMAIQALADGDTIQFNIPGSGVHYLQTPYNGYPLITNNNVTIDGYSQPGASPNSNPLHAANNAQIKIVLTSTNSYALSMQTACQAAAGVTYNHLGFGTDEEAILGFFRGTNATVRGFCFQGTPYSYSDAAPISAGGGYLKSVCFCPDSEEVGGTNATCAGWHVCGCWWGLDPATGQPVYVTDTYGDTWLAIPSHCIANYSTANDDGSDRQFSVGATVGVVKGSTNPAAEFNVFLTGYGIDLEGHDYRIAGNFFNVLPDGLHNFDITQYNPGPGNLDFTDWPFNSSNGGGPGGQAGDAFMECGRDDSNMTIGTDGDGVNDAYEGNVFSGAQAYQTGGGYHFVDIYFWSVSPGTNCVVAGNYFGVGVDGVTRFTNCCEIIHSLDNTATLRFGSDFDGVSDALEANVVYNDYPFATVFPGITQFNTDIEPPPLFDGGSELSNSQQAGSRVSFRGNITVGNPPVPFGYFDGQGVNPANARLTAWTNYESLYMVTNGSLVPILSAGGAFPTVQGTYPPGVAPYTNIIIDVYQADPEGWADGQTFGIDDYNNTLAANAMTDGATYTNGFAQGNKYIASFVMPDNSGNLSLSLPASAYAGLGQVTVTANYSADPPGTHNGRVHTSNFSDPTTLAAPVIITAATFQKGVLTVKWTGGTGPFALQRKSPITGSWISVQTGLVGGSTTYTDTAAEAFYRIAGN